MSLPGVSTTLPKTGFSTVGAFPSAASASSAARSAPAMTASMDSPVPEASITPRAVTSPRRHSPSMIRLQSFILFSSIRLCNQYSVFQW